MKARGLVRTFRRALLRVVGVDSVDGLELIEPLEIVLDELLTTAPVLTGILGFVAEGLDGVVLSGDSPKYLESKELNSSLLV